MPAVERRHWTPDEVRRLIDDAPAPTPRYEVVDGELLVTPSPADAHQRIVKRLVLRLDPYVEAQHLGELFISPSDVRPAPGLLLQPDVYVRLPESGRDEPDAAVSRLLVAIEVLSPSSARFDRVTKRRAYQAAGVPEYWIVDADAQTIERWRPRDTRPEIADVELTWHPDGAVEALRIDLASFFADVR